MCVCVCVCVYVILLSNCLRPSRHRAHTCQKWPAGLGDNSVLCLEFRHQKIFKNKTECWPFFGFFFDALWHLGCRKSVEICSRSSQKSVQREAWGGSGGSGWSPWRHLGPKMAQSSKKHEKRRITTYPLGTSGEPKFDKNVIWRHFLSFLCRYFSSLDFSTILGDFRLRN